MSIDLTVSRGEGARKMVGPSPVDVTDSPGNAYRGACDASADDRRSPGIFPTLGRGRTAGTALAPQQLDMKSGRGPVLRERIAQSVTQVADVLYVGLRIMLAIGAGALLVNAALNRVRRLLAGEIGTGFVLVAMIAAVRRILVITAELGTLMEPGEGAIRFAIIELGLLTVMTGVLVACLVYYARASTTRWPSGPEEGCHENPAIG